MPIDFPSNPSLNQVFSTNNKSWKWLGNRWSSFSEDFTNMVYVMGNQQQYTYTLNLSDNNKTLGIVAGVSATVIVPNNLLQGHQTNIIQLSTARVVLSAVGGVTLNGGLSSFRTTVNYSACTVLNIGSNFGWVAYGSLVIN